MSERATEQVEGGGGTRAGAPGRSLAGEVRAAAGDIKLSHSVFALPFALLGAFMGREEAAGWEEFSWLLGLVVACMVLARTWAMLVNRLADARYDAANPRTRGRALVSGRLGATRAAQFAGASFAGFMLVCLAFMLFFGNVWPALLGGPVLLWLGFYSFAKRFTWWCHMLLGSALGISPLAAALAVWPEGMASRVGLWWLAGMVTLWVAGFDIIYSLQDVEFDRATGLKSVPARFGPEGAIWMSRGLHAGALGCLALAARAEPRFGAVFWSGVGMVGVLLVVEHVHLARRGRAGIEMAFFTVNGVVSCVVGALGIVDVVW